MTRETAVLLYMLYSNQEEITSYNIPLYWLCDMTSDPVY